MSDSIEKHLVLWEARSPVPSQAFNNILKLLTKLYDAIAGILPTREVRFPIQCILFYHDDLNCLNSVVYNIDFLIIF